MCMHVLHCHMRVQKMANKCLAITAAVFTGHQPARDEPDMAFTQKNIHTVCVRKSRKVTGYLVC